MARSSRLRARYKLDELEIISLQANGDCFYLAVQRACENPAIAGERRHSESTIGRLREHVASQLNEETLGLYQQLHGAGIEGFEWFRGITTLHDFKDAVRKDSTAAGLSHCVWADNFAVVKILDLLNLRMLIVDDTIQAEGGSPFVTASPESPDAGLPVMYFVVHRSRRQHYNLFRDRDGVSLFSGSSLPPSVREKWKGQLNLPSVPEGEQHAGGAGAQQTAVESSLTSTGAEDGREGEEEGREVLADGGTKRKRGDEAGKAGEPEGMGPLSEMFPQLGQEALRLALESSQGDTDLAAAMLVNQIP